MDSKNVVVLGLKGRVVAFRKDTGARLWETRLKSSSFVTVVADDARVFAHTSGEFFCLDLQTGSQLWHDGLKGYGYDLASIALPGLPTALPAIVEKKRRDDAATSASTTTNTTH
jgi:outer membrane protein assembly factor BamB